MPTNGCRRFILNAAPCDSGSSWGNGWSDLHHLQILKNRDPQSHLQLDQECCSLLANEAQDAHGRIVTRHDS
jgi:hypothetical protein